MAFYTSENVGGISVGDEIYISFTQDYSLISSSLDADIRALSPNYIVFDISGSSLPQAGGLYTVTLNTEVTWDTYDSFWEAAEGVWDLSILENTLDTERALLFELIPDNQFLSDLEKPDYVTASLDIEEPEPYVSVRENSSYFVYNG